MRALSSIAVLLAIGLTAASCGWDDGTMAHAQNGLSDGPELTALADAIADYEGWTVGSVTWRANNPGALRWAEWQSDYSGQPCTPQLSARVGCKPGYTVFVTEDDGYAALVSLLRFYARQYPDWTIRDLMGTYAPTSDGNDPDAYAAFVADRVGVSASTDLAVFVR